MSPYRGRGAEPSFSTIYFFFWGADYRKTSAEYTMPSYPPFLGHLKKMAAISKVIRLSQKLRGADPSMSILSIGFVERRFQKKYCRIHHAIVSVILEAIKKMAAIFKVLRVILGTMTQIIVTLLSTYIMYGQYNSDSALLRASHNCGHNLAGCCGYLF